MIFYDISSTIEPDMPVYKNRDEKRPRFSISRDFSDGSTYEGRLDFDLHSGTHVDLPLHVIPTGANSDSWGSENFFTRCRILDFCSLTGDRITDRELRQKEEEALSSGIGPLFSAGRSILLKTANSKQDQFNFKFIFLEKSGAKYLADQKISGVGIDALGIERDQPGHETHKLLLQSGIWILEGLRLGEVPAGEYILVLLPLKISGVEALPARAVLLGPDSIKLPYERVGVI
jgi:arylformamidase